MTMYYLVYLPCLKVMGVSDDKADCDKAYSELGHDFDEDYKVMSDTEFLEVVVDCLGNTKRKGVSNGCDS